MVNIMLYLEMINMVLIMTFDSNNNYIGYVYYDDINKKIVIVK